jgi:hypothetical protein
MHFFQLCACKHAGLHHCNVLLLPRSDFLCVASGWIFEQTNVYNDLRVCIERHEGEGGGTGGG